MLTVLKSAAAKPNKQLEAWTEIKVKEVGQLGTDVEVELTKF